MIEVYYSSVLPVYFGQRTTATITMTMVFGGVHYNDENIILAEEVPPMTTTITTIICIIIIII